MTVKQFYQPNKYSVLTFIILFSIIFFIPYIPSQPSVGTTELVPEGKYPLIFIFLMSLVVIMEILMGNFVFADMFLFLGFSFAFFLLYTFTSFIGFIIKRKKEKEKKSNISNTPKPDDSYVLKLEEKESEDKNVDDAEFKE